ncbi:HpcH/HpaI aldolase family protein [Achromobacter aloeverae]
MTISNRLKQKMHARTPGLLNAWLTLGSPAIAELVSRQPWDAVTVDMQHGLGDFETTVSMLRAMNGTEITPMVRVPWMEPGLIQKVLDAGALGVICPMINTREECRQFVSVCRYAPVGSRSFGPTRAAVVGGQDYWKLANESVLTLAMIETAQAVENIEDIVSVDGLDGIYIGPSDLSLTLELSPGADLGHARLLDAVERVRAAAEAAGKFSVMHCSPIDYAVKMADKGFSLRTASSDSRMLVEAARELFRVLRPVAPSQGVAGY